jgi:hypothetical protein
VAEGQSGRCEVERAARLLGGCWCGVSVLGGEVGSRGAWMGVHRFEAMGKFGLSCSVVKTSMNEVFWSH